MSASPPGSTSGRPTLVIVGGPPGAGKTTIASGLSAALGWAVLRSDDVRREVVGGKPWAGSPEWMSTRFSPAATWATYQEMVRRAGVRLEAHDSIILDATWATDQVRALAQAAATAARSLLVAVNCCVPGAVAELRLERRIAAGADISMATVAIGRLIAESFAPWPSAHRVDTGAAVADTLDQALRAVRDAALADACAPAQAAAERGG